MKIGHIDLGEKPIMLAPMEDVTDIGFRHLCKTFGADMVYTEFVSADALVRAIPATLRKLQIRDDERPVGIQIYGRDASSMAEAARVVEEVHPDIIDINFGCPVKKIAGKGAGSGLLQNIPLLLEITKAVVNAVKTPVTVKTRLGWDTNNIIIDTLAESLQDCGIKALTIHGRTRSQMYTGQADWQPIAAVKKNPRIHIPIIGNGDICTPTDAKNAFDLYGVEAIMVGRASFGCPWIFRDMKAAVQGKKNISPLTTRQKIEILIDHLQTNIRLIGPQRGILHTRRHLAASPIFKGIPDFKKTRIAMLRAEDEKSLVSIIRDCIPLIEAHEGSNEV